LTDKPIKLYPTTLLLSNDSEPKAIKVKGTLRRVEDVAEVGPHANTNRTLTAPTLPAPTKAKAKVQAKAHAPLVKKRAKANPTLEPKETAIPPKTPVLTVVAPITTLALVSNALLKKKDKRQRFTNKPTKTSSLMRPSWNSPNQSCLSSTPNPFLTHTLSLGGRLTRTQQTMQNKQSTVKMVRDTLKKTTRRRENRKPPSALRPTLYGLCAFACS
jgi:hypothetical protein